MSWRRRVGLGLLGIGLLGGLVYASGFLLPADHRAEGTRRIAASPDRVWALISTFESTPTWRTGVTAVKRIEGGKLPTYEELNDFGSFRYEVVEAAAPERLHTRIQDHPDFGGSWYYALRGVDDSTEVTIIEEGVIHDPLFRMLSRFVFGYDGTILAYLDDLEDAARSGQ